MVKQSGCKLHTVTVTVEEGKKATLKVELVSEAEPPAGPATPPPVAVAPPPPPPPAAAPAHRGVGPAAGLADCAGRFADRRWGDRGRLRRVRPGAARPTRRRADAHLF